MDPMESTKGQITTDTQDSARIRMAPSILSADFLNFESSVSLVADGADFIHVDVMDGHFVPNLTIGPVFVKSLKKRFATPLDVHLMVDNPESTVDWYLDAGADLVTMHIEALVHANRAIAHVHDRGALAGIALNPATPIYMAREIVQYADLVLLMSVNPGFGGQSFIETTPRRIDELVCLCKDLCASPMIEIDGGITQHTAPLVSSRGANVLVAGSAVFKDPDPNAAMERIRMAAEAAVSL